MMRTKRMNNVIITIALIIITMIATSVMTTDYIIKTMRVDITEETPTGAIVTIDTMGQMNDYYVEK